MKKLFALLFLLSVHFSMAQTKDAFQSQKIDEDKIYTDFKELTEKPIFPGGGIEAFYAYIGHHFIIPEGAEGKMIIKFIVEKDGSIKDVTIEQDAGEGSGKKLSRLLKASPIWKPGNINGIPVRVQYTIPITIKNPIEKY